MLYFMDFSFSDFKKMGEGTKWTPVKGTVSPVMEERQSRRMEKVSEGKFIVIFIM